MKSLLHFLLLFAPMTALAQTAEEFFARGNAAYAEGDYEMAIAAYEGALERVHSASLHYNLAHAYAESGQVGPAVLHYSRALAIEPGKAEARHHLSQLREAVGLEDPPDGVLWSFSRAWHVDTWAWLATAGFWAIALGIALPMILKKLPRRPFLWATALGSLAFFLGLIGLLGYHQRGREGVILGENPQLRVAPTEQSPASADAREGVIAEFDERHEGFFLVRLPDGRTGWLAASEYQPIWDLLGT